MGFHIKNNNRNSRRKEHMADINITPFVDVLLVLLIIFMVAAPMMTGSVELELPRGANAASQPQEQPISVSIKSDGTIYLQEERVRLRSLPERLGVLTNNNINAQIFVRADTKIDYGRVMEAVRVINMAGFSQVVLVTELSN